MNLSFIRPIKWVGILVFLFLQVPSKAQCPRIYDLLVNGNPDFSACGGNYTIPLSVRGIQLPSGGEIKWLYSEDPNFDPAAGQGTLAGISNLPVIQSQPTTGQCASECPDLLMLFINSCNGSGLEPDNEFFVLNSGAGFFASDLQMDFDAANTSSGLQVDNDINIGSNPCLIKQPDAALINQLRAGTCSNVNLFPAGPGDVIPADAIVVFFTSSLVTIDYDFSTFCSSGRDVYIMQSGCRRTLGAFTNSNNCSGGQSIRTQTLSIKNCPCREDLNYDRCGLVNLDGEYVRDIGVAIPSVANGGVTRNNTNPCGSPDWSNFSKPDTLIKFNFQMPVSGSLCGKTLYFKAQVTPADPSCTATISNVASLTITGCPGSNVNSFSDEVCSGEPLNISLNNAPGITYTWTVQAGPGISGVAGGTTQSGNISQTPVSTSGTVQTITYFISASGSTCANGQDTVTITVQPGSVANITGATSFCTGQSTTLSVSALPSSQVLWSTGSSANSITVSNSGTFSVAISNGNCISRDTVTVTESAQLNPVITESGSFCENGFVTLTAEAGYDAYSWSTGATTASINVTTAGQYSVTVTKSGCTGTSSYDVAQQSALDLSVITTPPTCQGQSDAAAELVITYNGSFTVAWNNGAISQQLTNVLPGNYSYTISYGNNCTTTGNVTIPDVPALAADIAAQDVGCLDNELGNIEVLSVSNGNAPFQYALNGGAPGSATLFNDLPPGDYTVTITDRNGCKLDTVINIDQATLVSVNLPDTLFMTINVPIVLSPSLSGTGNGTSYIWTPADGLSCTTCPQPSANPSSDIIYQLEVINGSGCSDIDSVQIIVQPPKFIYVPEAFTPNGDGLNDKAGVLTSLEGVQVEIFQIFNRWGQKVFEASGFLAGNSQIGWNGSFDGEPAPTDGYLYFVRATFADGSPVTLKGVILLLR